MAIISKEEAQEILKKVVNFSSADHCSVNLGGSNTGNIRYARNTVSTSGITSDMSLAVNVAFGKRQGVATTNELEDESLKKVVMRAEELAKLAPENPEYMEPLGPQTYRESKTFVRATEEITPEFRAEIAMKSIERCKEKKLVAAGFLDDNSGFSSLMTSKGLFAYNKSTNLNFTLTVRTDDESGSGWVSRDVNDVDKFNAEEAIEIAAEKAAMSKEAKAVEPGKYTVILEPQAALGLMQNMFFNMNQRNADEGRNFLSKQGGGTKLGEKIVDERVNVYVDPLHEECPSNTWNGEGMPVENLSLIENGVVKNLFCSRYWAKEKNMEAIPFPGAGIMKGGDKSLDDLISETDRGILVTRFWYIRTVDPQTLLYTGLTRDGTFFIENGKIAYPIKNFRFNESPVIMLNNLDSLGECQRADGNWIPALKIRDFTFTSLSDAI